MCSITVTFRIGSIILFWAPRLCKKYNENYSNHKLSLLSFIQVIIIHPGILIFFFEKGLTNYTSDVMFSGWPIQCPT